MQLKSDQHVGERSFQITRLEHRMGEVSTVTGRNPQETIGDGQETVVDAARNHKT